VKLYEEIYQTYSGARISFLPMGGGYFQGVKTLGGFCSEEVELLFKKGKAVVRGEGLEIGKYCDGDVELKGKIRAVEVVEGEV
jgi:hypothetical protein